MTAQPYESLSSADAPTHQRDTSISGNQTLFSVSHDGESHQTPTSPPPSFHSHDTSERDHLVDAFDGSSDSEIDDDDWDDRQIVQSQAPGRGGFLGSFGDRYQSLQQESQSALPSTADSGVPTSPISSGASSSGPPASAPSTTAGRSSRGLLGMLPWIGGRTAPSLRANQNDGVFSNITAKPETDRPNEDFPPTYEEAASDQTPPYWETTIMAPGFGDEVFIEGLPVGSPINFIWNMMVSSAFQFVGFLLTYLLHTSHAAKQGSRAGLGFTLFQYGFYLQPNAAGDATTPAKEFEPSQPNNYDVSTKTEDVSGSFHQGSPSDGDASATMEASGASGWISVLLMVLGAIMILKAVVDYLRARKMELVIQGPSPPPIEPESPQSMV